MGGELRIISVGGNVMVVGGWRVGQTVDASEREVDKAGNEVVLITGFIRVETLREDDNDNNDPAGVDGRCKRNTSHVGLGRNVSPRTVTSKAGGDESRWQCLSAKWGGARCVEVST
jgi:hypothetical protein